MNYRHYSLDLWNTLIKPNPAFKTERTRYFHIYCLKRGILRGTEEIEKAFHDVWEYFDAHSQLFGKAPNALEMYAMVVFRLTGSLKKVSLLDMEIMYQEIEALFLQNPPMIYDEDTIPVLQELRAQGKTLSLLSNTSFIRGSTLDKVLETYGIKKYFVLRLYSDEIGYSKPRIECFQMVGDQLPYDKNEIIHVGDDELRDGMGAQDYGFDYMTINQPKYQSGNHHTIKDLL